MTIEIEFLTSHVDEFFDELDECLQESKIPFTPLLAVLLIERFNDDDVDDIIETQFAILSYSLLEEVAKDTVFSLNMDQKNHINRILSENYERLGFRDDCRAVIYCGLACSR